MGKRNRIQWPQSDRSTSLLSQHVYRMPGWLDLLGDYCTAEKTEGDEYIANTRRPCTSCDSETQVKQEGSALKVFSPERMMVLLHYKLDYLRVYYFHCGHMLVRSLGHEDALPHMTAA